MYFMIDNYDSFVYNLACYFEECGEQVVLGRNDKVSVKDLEALQYKGLLDGIILSPGPKSPKDCGNCKEILTAFSGKLPILGVCLGHQIIGDVFGAEITKGLCPMHGKISRISHRGTGLFQDLPKSYDVTRYHSLIVSEECFPDCLEIDARSEDGVIMGLHHKNYPVYGVQFHPEAVLTEYGHALLENFIKICHNWRISHDCNNS